MEKPYLHKLCDIFDFSVWIVDGKYIRANIDKEFSNFGQFYHFKYIPKNEFWLDKEYSPGEEKYFIDNLFVEHRLMKKGKNYLEASTKADFVEKREREKLKTVQALKKFTDENIIKKIHKRLLKNYSGKVGVWIVNGELVRSIFNINFTEGGHDKVYNFIPDNEVWIDDDVGKREIKFILLHELYERGLMVNGLDYDNAHKKASVLEWHCRHHLEELECKLKEEVKKNNNL